MIEKENEEGRRKGRWRSGMGEGGRGGKWIKGVVE